MGHQASKVGFESRIPQFFKTLVVRDAFSGEELCQLDNVDAKSTGLEVKDRIRKLIKDFAPSSKRLLWGSTILCDHLTLAEAIACSLSHDGLNPNELTVLNRPAHVQKWLENHRQIYENRLIYNSWTHMQRHTVGRRRPDLNAMMQFLNQGSHDQALQQLENGGDEIRSDVECMAALVCDDGLMIQYAYAELQDVDFLAMTAVKQNGLSLQYASPRLQDTDVIVSTAVKQDGLALQYASSRLQDTDLIVTTAVNQNGLALQHASCRLQDSDLIVWDALKQNGLALQYASSRLQNHDETVTSALRHNGQVLEFLSPKFQDDWSFVYIAFRQDTSLQRFASARIQARCSY
jgi:hypothetical protein